MSLFDTPNTRLTIPRDRFNRPLVIPPGGGKPVAYTRCTRFVDCLDDKYNLQRWQMRMVALGLSNRADLVLSTSAHRDDKRALDQIVDQAMEAAQSSASATTGTAVHALCERVDRGEPLGTIVSSAAADIAAYQAATAGMTHAHIEDFTVNDELKIGGTPDRVSMFNGGYYIVDIKTGKDISWGALKIAMQLAVYAHSEPYDPATGERSDYDYPVDQNRGIVIHLPAGEGHATLHFVDIAAGWYAVQTAREVRQWRSKKDWYEVITLPPLPPTDPFAGIPGADAVEVDIARASTVDELRQVWTRAIAAQSWTDGHLEKALARKEELERAS